MTTAQLIAELEKRGVLTWEEGDEATHKKYGYKFIVIDVEIGSENSPGDELSSRARKGIKAVNCTHSADDPRLLGRVLKAIEPIARIQYMGGGNPYHYLIDIYIRKTNEWVTVESGEGLLEAALKALLAKTEGEKS